MKLLFITSRFPYPPLKGDKIRAYYPIKLLSRCHEIDLLSFTEEGVSQEDLNEMKNYCKKINVVKLNKLYFFLMLVLGVFSLFPSQVLCYRSSRMATLIKKCLSNQKYDLVHIICGRLAGYKKYINGLPVFIDWIDALSMSTERMFRVETFLPKKLVYYFEWKKMKNYEGKMIDLFDYSIITSKVDKEYLENNIDEVIPNGVDTSIFYPMNHIKKDIDLIFTGNMGYFPNVKAVEFFCDKVMPLILKVRPETTFYIVGINPVNTITRYHDGKNVFVTGFVDDLMGFLNRSKIFVAPLQSGAGIQNKILEAMACSIPVISTFYGNAGIQAKDNEEIILSNDQETFSDSVLNLLSDELKTSHIGSEGYNLVHKKFNWKSVTERINNIYKELMSC